MFRFHRGPSFLLYRGLGTLGQLFHGGSSDLSEWFADRHHAIRRVAKLSLPTVLFCFIGENGNNRRFLLFSLMELFVNRIAIKMDTIKLFFITFSARSTSILSIPHLFHNACNNSTKIESNSQLQFEIWKKMIRISFILLYIAYIYCLYLW